MTLRSLALRDGSDLGTSPIMSIPAEVRLQIFRFVFQGDSKVVRLVAQGLLPRHTVNTALFTVTKQISQEAQDAFFRIHTVVATNLRTSCKSIPLFHHIEFREGRSLQLWPARIIQACSPKLKTIVLARENLSFRSTLRQYLIHKPGVSVRSLELGLHRIESDECVGRQVFVKNFEIAHYLPDAEALASRSTLADLRRHGSIASLLSDSKENVVVRLALWLTAYEMFTSQSVGQVPAQDMDFLADWHHKALRQATPTMLRHEKKPDGVKLQDLDVAKHGSEVVEWASELIGAHLHGIVRTPRDQMVSA